MKFLKILAAVLAVMTLGMSAGLAASLEDMIYQDLLDYVHPDGMAPYYVGKLGYSEFEWWSAAEGARARAKADGTWPSWWEDTLNPVFETSFADLVSSIRDELWSGKYPHDMMEIMVTDKGSLTGKALCTLAEWQAAAVQAVREYQEDRGMYTYDFEESYLDGSFFQSPEYLAHLESIGLKPVGGDASDWNAASNADVWSPDDFEPGEPVWVDGRYVWRNLDGTFDDYFYEDIFGTSKSASARDLGDESTPLYVFGSVAAAALGGAAFARKKRASIR